MRENGFDFEEEQDAVKRTSVEKANKTLRQAKVLYGRGSPAVEDKQKVMPHS